MALSVKIKILKTKKKFLNIFDLLDYYNVSLHLLSVYIEDKNFKKILIEKLRHNRLTETQEREVNCRYYLRCLDDYVIKNKHFICLTCNKKDFKEFFSYEEV